jgi:hypothetical protein
MYKLTDDYKEIVVEEASENGDWDYFREKLINAQSKTKTVRSPASRLYLHIAWATREIGLTS